MSHFCCPVLSHPAPQQRKRHYWRLDCKCIILFQNNTSNKYYKVSTVDIIIFYIWLILNFSVITCMCLQEIPLSEILQVRPATDFTLVPQGTNPHCFELITGTMCYFVGEDPNTLPSMSSSNTQTVPQTPPSPSLVQPNSGIGREVANAWESAIRQALMPVIFQDAPPAEGNTPHSKLSFMVVKGTG